MKQKINTKRPGIIIFLLSFMIIVFANSQNLLLPKNNLEYMCIPFEVLSDFDNSNDFTVDTKANLTHEQKLLKVETQIVSDGINKSKCLRVQPSAQTKKNKTGEYYLKYDKPIFIKNAFEGIGVWLKSNNDAMVNFNFEDANGYRFVIPKKNIQSNINWEYSYAVTDSYSKANDSASARDVTITYPCKFLGLSFEIMEENTIIYIDEIYKVKENDRKLTAQFEVTPQKLANTYLLNEKVVATITSASNKLKLIIKNYKGDIIKEITGDRTLQLQLPTNVNGYFELLVLSYKDEINPTKLVNGAMFRYAAIDGEVVYNDKLGVATHPDRDYYSEKCIDLLPIIGSRYMRFGIVLGAIENKDGTFTLPNKTIDILSKAKDNGTKFVCIVRDKIPPLTVDLKEKFLNYCRFLLNSYRNVIDKVELWNEWSNETGTNSKYKGQQTAENYYDFVKSIYPVLKTEYPEVEFIGLGGENPQRFRHHIVNMLEAGAGQYMDAISLHPYRLPTAPDSRTTRVHNLTMSEQVEDIVELARKHNAPEKVYITEIGYAGHLSPGGINDLVQAQYTVKLLGLLFTTNVVEQIDLYNLYEMKELGTRQYKKEEDYPQLHFGLFNGARDNFAIKPAALAYRFFAKITAGVNKGEQYDDKNGFFKLTFKKNENDILIVWNNNARIKYPIPAGSTVYNLMGNIIQHSGYIMLDREPVYIVK